MIRAALLAAALLLAPAAARAEITLPPGFTAQVYVTGEGFDEGRAVAGIPSTSTIVLDGAGTLYAARTGRRYIGGEIEDLWPIYRFAAGGGRMTRETERRFLYGPPLPNPQVAAARGASCWSRRSIATAWSASSIASWTAAPSCSPAVRRPAA